MTQALIVGGGIGGLTTALWLHRIGVEVTVFEAVPEVKPLGVGINLLPHATKVLHQLGLLDRLEATAILTRELRYHSQRWENDLGGAARAPCVTTKEDTRPPSVGPNTHQSLFL
jgi:5-methylphenazine-1-carboxylate 1-monooxygenase